MRRQLTTGGLCTLLLLASTAWAEDLKSGPPVGSSKIPSFSPLHATGPDESGRSCLV